MEALLLGNKAASCCACCCCSRQGKLVSTPCSPTHIMQSEVSWACISGRDLLLGCSLLLRLLLLLEAGQRHLGLLHAPAGLDKYGSLLSIPAVPPVQDRLPVSLPSMADRSQWCMPTIPCVQLGCMPAFLACNFDVHCNSIRNDAVQDADCGLWAVCPAGCLPNTACRWHCSCSLHGEIFPGCDCCHVHVLQHGNRRLHTQRHQHGHSDP